MSKRKRQEMRDRRNLQKRKQRTIVIAAITVGVLLMAAAIISSQNKSISDVVSITPIARPMINGTAMGDPNAPVQIDVFEDFQCPSCARYSKDVEPLVVSAYVETGKVYYVFHNFPFIDDASSTRESDQAASASLCAGEQGRFWDYHDTLFANWSGENVGAFADKRLVAFAETLGLDMTAFNACFEAGRYMDEAQADYQLGVTMGVQGTPSVFVNGTQVAPGYIPSIQDIQQAVEAALAGQ